MPLLPRQFAFGFAVISSGALWVLGNNSSILADIPDENSLLPVKINGELSHSPIEFLDRSGGTDRFQIEVGLPLAIERRDDLQFKVDSELKFETEPPSQVHLISDNNPPRMVGAIIRWKYSIDGTRTAVNPLDSMTEQEIHGLWGLQIKFWQDDYADKVGQISPEDTLVEIATGGFQSSNERFPVLPAALKRLSILAWNDQLNDLDRLRRLTKLTSLRFSWPDSFDCSLIENATELETLRFGGGELKNIASLMRLTKLRTLDLSHCKGIHDLSFLKPMQDLENLQLEWTGVGDLSPLQSLPKLKRVNAFKTPVHKLPTSVPMLQELQVMTTSLHEDDVKAFRTSNPQCRVRYHWTPPLLEALLPATKMKVTPRGGFGDDADKKKFCSKQKMSSKSSSS